MVLEKIIVAGCDQALVRRRDGLHLFDESLAVATEPPPKKPVARKLSDVLIDDRANRVQIVLKNGHVAVVEY